MKSVYVHVHVISLSILKESEKVISPKSHYIILIFLVMLSQSSFFNKLFYSFSRVKVTCISKPL